MPRGRKKTTGTTEQQATPVAEAAPEQAAIHAVVEQVAEPVASALPTVVEPPVAELREPLAGVQEIPDSGSPASGQRERFRTWVTDTARGYSRTTDNQFQRLVLQFSQKPSAEILTALKEGGFHYQPDYLGHKNAWVRRNDYTGRVQVEAIEKLVRAQSAVAESVER